MRTITQLPWKKWLLAILLLTTFSCLSLAQEATVYTATINKKNLIQIDNSNPEVQSSYLADISSMGFVSEQAGIEKFNMLTDNLVSFKLNWSTQTVSIILRIDQSNSSWTTIEWNKYLLDKSKW